MQEKIVFIGGDERTIYFMNKLAQLTRKEIIAVGFKNEEKLIDSIVQKKLTDLPYKSIRYVVLPLQGIDKSYRVNTINNEQKLQLSEDFFKNLRTNTLLFVGNETEHLKNLAKQHSLQIISLLQRNDLAIKNSIPTAEGTLLVALENINYTIHNADVLITGFGRIGQTVANTFHALGANVFIYTKEVSDEARAFCDHLNVLTKDEMKRKLARSNIIINTIPTRFFDNNLLRLIKQNTLIIELSSFPYGVDVDEAKKLQLPIVIADGLPGKVAPLTAGEMLAEVLSDYIK